MDIKEFITRSNEIHNNKYDYSLVKYVNYKTKVEIICPIHGSFWQVPNSHLRGYGCKKCSVINNGLNRRLSYEEFIKKCNQMHNYRFNYSKVEYKGNRSKITIICPIHGEFEQIAASHLDGLGCKLCSKELEKLTQEEFIERANLKHGNKYDYSKIKYVNTKIKVCIICSEHGEFWQRPDSHLYNLQGCPACNEPKGEKQIRKWLENNNIKFISQKIFEDCRNERVLSFDFYLPDYNLCIEFDGLQHFKIVEWFGGEKGFLKQKENDKIKNQYCKDNEIGLIRIPYQNLHSIDKILLNKIKILSNE